MKKNVASQVVGAELIAKADGTPVTAGTTTAYVTGDNGTQAAGSVGSGACTHKGNGWWSYAPAQAETNYDHVAFTFVNTSGVNATVQIYTSFPQTGDNYARLGAPAGASVSADIAALQTGVNDLPTNAELATALGTADDAVLTAINDLPTNAELATALGTADDAVLAQVALVKAKTDNLPTDPADASVIAAAFAVTDGKIDAVAGFVDTEVAAIKAVTDKLDTALELDGSVYRYTTNALEQAPTGGSAPTAAAIADAVWDEALSGHAISGSTGEALAAAGAAGDPWGIALPGAYTAGEAGYILGTNLNATVSSRATQTSVDDLPTNAELATALGTSDDAVLVAIDALPTNAELSIALGTSDDAVLAAIAALSVPTAAQNADKLLDRHLAGGSDDTGPQARSVRNALRALRNKSDIGITTAGKITVTTEDDSTVAWTGNATTGPGDPLTSIDPD